MTVPTASPSCCAITRSFSEAQVVKLLGTTKETIQKVRDRAHWNSANIKPRDPVILGLCSQTDLNAMVQPRQTIAWRARAAPCRPRPCRKPTKPPEFDKPKPQMVLGRRYKKRGLLPPFFRPVPQFFLDREDAVYRANLSWLCKRSISSFSRNFCSFKRLSVPSSGRGRWSSSAIRHFQTGVTLLQAVDAGLQAHGASMRLGAPQMTRVY